MKKSKTFSIIIICLSFFISVNINAFEKPNQPKNTHKSKENRDIDKHAKSKKDRNKKKFYDVILYGCTPYPGCGKEEADTPSYHFFDFLFNYEQIEEYLEELSEQSDEDIDISEESSEQSEKEGE